MDEADIATKICFPTPCVYSNFSRSAFIRGLTFRYTYYSLKEEQRLKVKADVGI